MVKVLAASQAEICNGLDDDSDGLTDEGLPVGGPSVDADLDGFDLCPPAGGCPGPGGPFDCADCNDQIASINPGAIELCNGLDDNCDGLIDEGSACVIPTLSPTGVLLLALLLMIVMALVMRRRRTA